MLAYVRTPSGATCKGVLQLEVTFIDVKKHLSPPGLVPGSLEYRSNALTTKLRRHNGEEHAFHISIPSDGYTSIPYTPLPGCFLILNYLKAANKL